MFFKQSSLFRYFHSKLHNTTSIVGIHLRKIMYGNLTDTLKSAQIRWMWEFEISIRNDQVFQEFSFNFSSSCLSTFCFCTLEMLRMLHNTCGMLKKFRNITNPIKVRESFAICYVTCCLLPLILSLTFPIEFSWAFSKFFCNLKRSYKPLMWISTS